ncbi:hypothetical protein IW262DRAFT_1420037 [Armillaria fumosa]|nr:hypothetical protein IW262DRAFT_1420037 [Armillaria fumosa]
MCFGYDIQKLNGDKVHSLFNDVTNCYNVRSFESQFFESPMQVTFTTSDSEQLPVPYVVLLALHATCARVAHLSGEAKHIDKLDHDADNLGILAPDGSSAEVLSSTLWNCMALVLIFRRY